MGDFNINSHKSKLLSKNNTHITETNTPPNINKDYVIQHYYHKNIIKTLKQSQFKDLVKIFHNPSPPTFFNTSNHSSYIDIIFGSRNLIQYVIFGNIINAPISTDHKLIFIFINNSFFYNTNNYINTQSNNIEITHKKMISFTKCINYKKITQDQWNDFHNFIWEVYSRLNSNTMLNNNPQTYINQIYENIKNSINSTIRSLKFPIIKNNSHQYEYSHKIRVIQNDYYYIKKLIRLIHLYFNAKTNTKHMPTLKFWEEYNKLKRLNEYLMKIKSNQLLIKWVKNGNGRQNLTPTT
ncbi:hypothetical protein C1646_750316 [Rhizophagus diaphanus]|nr:hypothetical protein C1646_750316 [Rhizophagus diaphanus] [Rhizophagus sp. MUCL 43196]